MLHSYFMHVVVGIFFTLLIFGGPLLLIWVYPLTAFAGGFSSFIRRPYKHAPWKVRKTDDKE